MALNKLYKLVPGTTVFDIEMAAKGYHLNQFCMTLLKKENRTAFKADERAYLDSTKMSEEQKQAVLDRDYNRMIDLGGNIYFISKIFSTDQHSFQYAASLMTGMREEDYKNMMIAGGRSPKGNMLTAEEIKKWQE